MNPLKTSKKMCPFPAREIKGSFTLEAAVLVPLTVLLMAAVILASFYIHDRAVLQGNACECTAAGANALTQPQQARAMSSAKSLIKAGRLLGSRNRGGQISAQGDHAETIWTAEYPIPGMVGSLFADRQIPISVSWSQEKIHAAGKIRIIRGISKILKNTGKENE